MKFGEAAELLGLEDGLCAGEGELREAFRAAGKRLHPDAGGSVEEFERLQAALRMMLRPGERLRAWLEQNGVAGEVRGSLSNGVMDHFSPVAEVVQRAQGVAKEAEACRSALGKALLEPRRNEVRQQIAAAQGELSALVEARVGRFEELKAGAMDGGAAWQMVRDLLFLEKWQGQLREEFGKSF